MKNARKQKNTEDIFRRTITAHDLTPKKREKCRELKEMRERERGENVLYIDST